MIHGDISMHTSILPSMVGPSWAAGQERGPRNRSNGLGTSAVAVDAPQVPAGLGPVTVSVVLLPTVKTP
jgi:hypothetical protein